MVKETSRRHNIRGFDQDLDDDLIQDFMQRLNKMYKDQTAALERVKVGSFPSVIGPSILSFGTA